MLLLLAEPEAARGRHLLLLHPPLLRGKYVISNFSSSSSFLYRVFLRLTPILVDSFLFFFFFGSLNTRTNLSLILYCLISPNLKYVSLFSLSFFFLFCTYFPCHVSLIAPFFSLLFFSLHQLSCIVLPFIFFFFFCFTFFRLSPSLSPYITPRLRRFLLPWAHPLRVL